MPLSQDTMLKITKARSQMMKDEPFYGYLSLFLEPVEFPKEMAEIYEKIGVPLTFATDGKKMYINEKFCSELSVEDIKFIFAHEITHVSLDHLKRKFGRDKQIWNMAIDYATNGLLVDDGMKIPTGKHAGLLDGKFNGKSSEEVYDILIQQAKQNKGGKNGKGTGNNFDIHLVISDDPSEDGDIEKQLEAQGIKLDPQALDNLKREIITSAKMALQQGKCPSFAKRLVEELVAPKINWRKVLYRFIQENVAMNDYSFARLKRNYMSNGIAMPSLRSQEPPPIGIAIDNSGSISEHDLQQFLSEINGIARIGWNFPVHVFVCDADIHFYKKFCAREITPAKIDLTGGGGTDFRPVFNKIKNEHIYIRALIYLTDCEGRFPDNRPDYPVLWIKNNKSETKAPFGLTCEMGD